MKCNFVKSNNEVCGNNSMIEDSRCFWHSDKISEDEKNLCRSNGGKVRQIRIKTEYENFELNTIADVMKLNALLINEVLKNKISLRVLTGISYSLSLQMRLIEVENIEKRLSLLEDKISNTDNELSE